MKSMITTRGRRICVGLLAAGAGVTGILAGVAPANAAPADNVAVAHHSAPHPDGWYAVQSCASMTGSVQFQPGLDGALRKQNAVLSATLDDCTLNGAAASGQGTLNAVLSGKASKTSESLTGTYTINWPASEGLNPSTGTISLSGPQQNVVTLSGTGTGGAFNGLPINSAYFISGHHGAGTRHKPITSQSFVNTVPLQVKENLG